MRHRHYESENCRPVTDACHINSKLFGLKRIHAHAEPRKTRELKSEQIQDFYTGHMTENKRGGGRKTPTSGVSHKKLINQNRE